MDLKEKRAQIDKIDEKLTALFVERMKAAGEIALYKKEQGLPILNAAREREILNRVSGLAGDELDGYARILFSTLFDLSRSYQSSCMGWQSRTAEQIARALAETPKVFPAKGIVACQGVEGAYSQQACDKMFSFANILYFKNFEGVFSAVEKGLCQYGVLPIENSTHGSVNEVYDLMRGHNFHIVKSMRLHISHSLLARPGVKLTDIKEIFSHEQAIGQCADFLAKLPDVKVTVCENTAVAAKMVAESDRTDIAAISSKDCAGIYGLTILQDHVHNTDNNYTRFITIAKKPEIYPGSNKISLMISVPNSPGSLTRTLAKFSSLGVNMTKLESRPLAGTDFQYMFYLDFDASIYSPEVISLLSELENEMELFVFLGAYSEV
jgi:chorismate mutase/prephenate dehydratase